MLVWKFAAYFLLEKSIKSQLKYFSIPQKGLHQKRFSRLYIFKSIKAIGNTHEHMGYFSFQLATAVTIS